MAHLSPAVYLVWTLLTIMLGSFLVFHLWSFDRFKCLRWNQGPHSGAFKRVMTYSYLLSIPLIITYALGFAIIKYTYGFTVIPGVGVISTPYELWSQSAQNAIFPLYLSLSIGWGLELVTHLEEHCFWLFLVNASSAHQDWFGSIYFKIWAVGSSAAVLAMPLITIFTRENYHKCEAYTFMVGGLAGLSLTIWFLPILWTFPSFMASLRLHGIQSTTLVRLTKYHELNCVRVVFRFLFTVPLVILGVDGIRPHQHINDKMFPTDLLGIISAIGCAVSSGITLVIFFPRSIEGEMAQREQQRARRRPQSTADVEQCDPFASQTNPYGSGLPTYEVAMAPLRDGEGDHARALSTQKALEDKPGSMGHVGGSLLQPNRRTVGGNVELGAVLSGSEVDLARARSSRDQRMSSLVDRWRSPIEIGRPGPSASRWQRQVP